MIIKILSENAKRKKNLCEPTNLLFTNENVLDNLSSDEDENDDETEEEDLSCELPLEMD